MNDINLNPPGATEEAADLSHDQIAQRRAKLEALRSEGGAYPNHFRPDIDCATFNQRFGELDAEALTAETTVFRIAGRMMTRRIMGKAAFAHLQDHGERLQIYVRKDALGDAGFEAFKHLDIGDILAVTGTPFRTRSGELSLEVQSLELLTKALRPLPEKFHGLADQETCYRQRYLDLIMNAGSRQRFVLRSRVIDYLRSFFRERGFLEVETPMMQLIPGGAAARPFITHHNALDMDLYLRVAPELYLKRLVVGGFERVFEINRNFRNEGLSTRHNPEFTMLEFYQAYADYRELMDLTEELLRGLALSVLGTTAVHYQGRDHDLAAPFQRMTVVEAILAHNPALTSADINTHAAACATAAGLGIALPEGCGLGKAQIEIFEKTVENNLHAPTFITGYPAEVSPLARRSEEHAELTDRFEFFVGGRELANGFSELNDPDDQAERFRLQVAAKAGGDAEAMHFDADYIEALEYGMPPTAGEGIGIDRLVMFLTDSPSIRDVLLFPHMRPRS
jgi:lysyl-tRNA synthetase, class II